MGFNVWISISFVFLIYTYISLKAGGSYLWAKIQSFIFKRKGAVWLKLYGNGLAKYEFIKHPPENKISFNKAKDEDDKEYLFYSTPHYMLVKDKKHSNLMTSGEPLYIAVEGFGFDAFFKYRDYEELINKLKEYNRLIRFVWYKQKGLPENELMNYVKKWYSTTPANFHKVKFKEFMSYDVAKLRTEFKLKFAKLYTQMQYTTNAKNIIAEMLKLEIPYRDPGTQKIRIRDWETVLVKYQEGIKSLIKVLESKTNTFVSAIDIFKNNKFSKNMQIYIAKMFDMGVREGARMQSKKSKTAVNTFIGIAIVIIVLIGYQWYNSDKQVKDLQAQLVDYKLKLNTCQNNTLNVINDTNNVNNLVNSPVQTAQGGDAHSSTNK